MIYPIKKVSSIIITSTDVVSLMLSCSYFLYDSIFSPHHFVDHIHIALDNAHNLHGHIFIRIVRARFAQHSIVLHLDSHVGGLQQLLSGDTRQDEVARFHGLRALGGRANTHRCNGCPMDK